MLAFTLGHSTISLEEFLSILKENKIEAVADVRSKPFSSRHPQYNKENLGKELAKRGIECRWFPGLGGFRGPKKSHWPGKCLKKGGREAYIKHMESEEFKRSFSKLLEMIEGKITAIMCSERDHQKCHRSLISEKLERKGVRVIHLRGKASAQ